jgi:hypothetical protein
MSDPNTRFLVHLKKIGEKPAGYRAVHLHISQLPAAKKTRDNLSRAIGLLSDLKAKYQDGEIFLMKNVDIVFITKEISKPILAAACDAVEQTFVGKMGVTFTNVHGGERQSYTLFDLANDYPKLRDWAEETAGVSQTAAAAPEIKGEIDLSMLSRIKEEVQKIDIAPMLFNQPVYYIGDEGKVQATFHEMYISVQVLEEMFCPGLSLTSRRWLFADLTEDLDTVVLRLLADPEQRAHHKGMSINVNLSSLASTKFVKFDAELPAERRQGVILEINKTDIFENMRMFRELAPFLRSRGYRILLDGLSFANVEAIDFDGIECDFAKVFWSGEPAAMSDESLARVTVKMRRPSKPRFILARCDAAESIRFAKSIGLKLVQGRLVDHMVKRNIPL